MKKISMILCVVMLISILSGCQGSKTNTDPANGDQDTPVVSSEPVDPVVEENTDPFYKYPETVNLTAGVEVYGAAEKLPEGDTVEDNRYTRYFEEKTNIKVTNAFEAQFGDAYNQKVKLSFASDDLPDFMIVRQSEYATFKQMAEFDMIADLTEYYDTYVNPAIKVRYDSGDGSAINQVTLDGKLMALPEPALMNDTTSLLWVRQDWLNNLGLTMPTTVDEIQNIAKAFRDNDPDQNGENDTVSLIAEPALIQSDEGSLEALFGSFDSYPQYWYQKDGNVVYGSTTDETRTALIKLAEMYADGSIDKEFVSRTDNGELVSSGKAGIFFAPWWAPWSSLSDNVKNNPKADWVSVTAPFNKDGEYVSRVPAPNNCFLVVSSECKNIDAVMRYFNVCTDQNPIIEADLYEGESGLGESYRLSAVSMVLDYINAIPFKNYYYNKILDGKAQIGDDEEINEFETQFNIDAINKVKSGTFEIADWGQYAAYMIGAKPLYDNPKLKTLEGAYYGTTPTMELKWVNLKKIEMETFLSIITGSSDISAFDDFVIGWKSQGGDEITKEISDIVD